LLLPGVGQALGPNGGDYSTTATAYANVHTGVTYNGTYAYDGDQDFYRILSSRPNTQLALTFGNDLSGICYDYNETACGNDGNGDYVNPGDNTGVCYPFPYTGYDECNVEIQVYDSQGDELVPFLANSVAYWGQFTLDPIVLSDPGTYYIGITGDESIDSAPSLVPIPYHFSVASAPGLGVDRLPQPQPPPPDIYRVGAIFPKPIKQEAELLNNSLDAADAVKTDAMIFGLVDPEFNIEEFVVTSLIGVFYDDVANDPPQPRYAAVVRLQPLKPRPIAPHGRLTRAGAHTLNALVNADDRVLEYGRATLSSFERFKGAERAGNKHWERIQLQWLVRYSTQFSAALSAEVKARAAAARVVQTLGGSQPISSVKLAAARRRMSRHGLPVTLRRELAAAGLTSAQQRQLLKRFTRGKSNDGSTLVSTLTDARVTGALEAVAQASAALHQEAVDGLKRL
jgi:hypothetical protein